MEKEKIQFDMSADKLLDIADEKLDEGDFLGALRMLHKSVEMYGPAADEYASLAEAYEEMELYQLSADCWFKFLDVCAEEDEADGYEGLAACYYNLGNEEVAEYYYDLTGQDKYITHLRNLEIGELLKKAKEDRPRLKVVWPPDKADYYETIEEGLRSLRMGDFEGAEKILQDVPEGADGHASAMNFLAVGHILSGQTEKAEKICKELLEKDPDSVQLQATYAALLTEENRFEEGRAVAEKLAKTETEIPDELFKIATLCCEYKLYDEGYKKFCHLETIVQYDLSLLFFKAVAAFKSGRVKESLKTLGKLLDIKPTAAVARHYYREIQAYSENGGEEPEIGFIYRVPQKEREDRLKALYFLAKMPLSTAKEVGEEADIIELLEWCFDEGDGQEEKLQELGITAAFRCDQPDFILDQLLSTAVSDSVKTVAVRMLCEKNREFDCSVVISDRFKKLSFERLEVGKTKRAVFVKAYALCLARIATVSIMPDIESDWKVYKLAAQRVYGELERKGKLAEIKDVRTLATVIAVMANPKGNIGNSLLGTALYLKADEHAAWRLLTAVLARSEPQAEAAAADAEKEGEKKDEAD